MDSLEAERRSIGTSMVADRTGKQVQQAINQLTTPRPAGAPLKQLDTKGALDAKRGRGVYTAPPATGTGGISGPLVEVKDSRVYYDDRVNLYSNDYLMAVEVRPLKSLSFTDGSGATFQMQFAQPKMEG